MLAPCAYAHPHCAQIQCPNLHSWFVSAAPRTRRGKSQEWRRSGCGFGVVGIHQRRVSHTRRGGLRSGILPQAGLASVDCDGGGGSASSVQAGIAAHAEPNVVHVVHVAPSNSRLL